MPEFVPFQKIPRLSREVIITEKIDGTNASILITPVNDYPLVDTIFDVPVEAVAVVGDLVLMAGSRTRWITPKSDNYGFASWVLANATELVKLGPGHHFGEWWGGGIQRGYGLAKGDKRFSLFNVSKWGDPDSRPSVVGVVPVIGRGMFSSEVVSTALERLRTFGSVAAPGFMDPEGIVIYHIQGGILFKKTLKGDESPKGKQE